MGEAPKLYVNKPKKAQMKKVKGIDAKSSSTPPPSSSQLPTSSAISSYYSTGSTGSGGDGGGGGVLKPPEVPKESFARRYKYMWPLLLTVNLAVGAYLFMRTKKKDVAIEEESPAPPGPLAPAPTLSASIAPTTAAAVTENLPVAQPVKVLEPIPLTQQRELFEWMLEEKRKIKTNNPVEKKRIDEEKAILKQFIQAKSIPNI